MDPEKERLRAVPLPEPRQGGIGHALRRALAQAAERLAGKRFRPIVVMVEPLGEPVAGVEDETRHEGRGDVPVRFQDFGESDLRRVEPVLSVVPDSVMVGIEPGQDRAVGREGDGCGRNGVREPDALFREPIEMRSLRFFVPVGAQTIGARGVEGDEDDVERSGGAARQNLPRVAGAEKEHEEQGSATHRESILREQGEDQTRR